jgi:TRAP-type C4-dicarboxylate transport system substrate-binding protein
MKKNIVKSLAALLTLSVLIPLGAQTRIDLKIASVAPDRSPWDIEQRALAQEWAQITGGLVNMTFFNAASLGGEKAVIQKFRSVRPGQKAPLDGAIFTTIGLHELSPTASVYTLSIPFLIRNQTELDAVLKNIGPELITEYRKSGFEMIAWTNVGWLSFYTQDSYKTLGELKKIKLASAGLDSPVLGDTFRAANFTIEDITMSKLLQSLKSTGGVRGFFGVHMFAYVTGLSKTVKYALDTKLCPVIAGLVISNEAWAKIPAQYKPQLVAAAERMRVRLDASLDQSDKKYLDTMKQEGLIAITPTAADLAAWEAEFAKDFDKVNKTVPGAFSPAMYQRIRTLVQGMRK